MKSDKSRLLAPHSKHILPGLGPPIPVSSRAEPAVCQPEQTFTNFNCNNVGNERAVFPLLLVLSSSEWHMPPMFSPSRTLSLIRQCSPLPPARWRSANCSDLSQSTNSHCESSPVLTSSHCGCLVSWEQRQEVTWAVSSQSEASIRGGVTNQRAVTGSASGLRITGCYSLQTVTGHRSGSQWTLSY